MQLQSTKILNLSHVPITQDETDILKLGLSFRPTPKQNIANSRMIFFNLLENYDWFTITETATFLMNLLLN